MTASLEPQKSELVTKLVWIVGAGRGIGRTIALKLAGLGARVVLSSRSETELAETAGQIQQELHQESICIPCDVADAKQVRAVAAKIEKDFGAVDGLVCAAAVSGPIGYFEENDLDQWEHAVEINLLGSVRCVHAVAGVMKKRGSGRIALFSGGGQGSYERYSSYVAAKGAIWRLTETLGAELAPFGVFVNAIAPGAVNTRFLDDLLNAGPERVGQQTYDRALKQKASGGTSPDKAADLVEYLFSKASTGLYGKTLSALWDDYRGLDAVAASKTDLYTMKRVVTQSGGTRF